MTPRTLAEEAADPSTTPTRMREIIQTDRSLYATVACNPNVDEPLRQWLWTNGGAEVQQAMVRQYEEAVRSQEEARAAANKAKEPARAQADAGAAAGADQDRLDAQGLAEAKREAAERERAATERRRAERMRRDAELRAEAEAAARAYVDEDSETDAEAARAEAEARANAEAAARQSRQTRHGWTAEGFGSPAAGHSGDDDAARAAAGSLGAERLTAEEAARAEEQRRLAEELASFQAEARAGLMTGGIGTAAAAIDPSPAANLEPDEDDFDEDEETIIVSRVRRPKTVLTAGSGQSFELTEDIVILGRNPRGAITRGAQVVRIVDSEKTMSKTHARLTWHDDAWHITDLESTNGVFVGSRHEAIEIPPDQEVPLSGPFALGLHQMELSVAQ